MILAEGGMRDTTIVGHSIWQIIIYKNSFPLFGEKAGTIMQNLLALQATENLVDN